MNILLTGGAGYIGSHTAVALIEAGYNIFIYDNFVNSHYQVISKLKEITGVTINTIEGDIRDLNLLTKVLSNNNIDVVMHFAGLKAVNESIHNPMLYYSNNVVGAINLIEAMKFAKIKKIIFSSSATVYGNPEYLPIDEVHPVKAINPYGETKICIEQILKYLADSDNEWKILSLRYFNPLGSHESGLIGENPKGQPNNLMPFLLKVANKEIDSLIIHGGDYETKDGTCIRDYIHIKDLANGHLAGLKNIEEINGFLAVNLGTSMGCSVREIIDIFEKANGKKINFKIGPRRNGDVAVCFASALKAKETLKWSASLTLEDMCKTAWNFYEKTH